MDLKDQLKKLFPEHQELELETNFEEEKQNFLFNTPLICKYEKRNGKPITLIEGLIGPDSEIKLLAKEIKTQLNVGGSFKNETLLIQGNYRDKIMDLLKSKGFKVKRVGG